MVSFLYGNKYGGRTYNDLNQYPVFPWIIQDYKSASIKLSSKEIYRPLINTIASINPEKRKVADKNIADLVKDSVGQYQFDVHYLPPQAVFGYMIRINPYSSLLSKYKDNPYSNDWIFDGMEQSWALSTGIYNDNKELIPEFFYLPEMFWNSNMRLFGIKLNNDRKKQTLQHVLLPPWAENSHQFIQMNSLALESNQVSFELEKWIELIFGENQQNHRFYNMYKALSDESNIRLIKFPLINQQKLQLQECGLNPIRLFRESHPPRDEKRIKEKNKYAINRFEMNKRKTKNLEKNNVETNKMKRNKLEKKKM